MTKLRCIRLFLFVMAAGVAAAEEEPPYLHPELEPFESLLGKTWVGHFAGSPGGAKMEDVVRYERALNGMAVRSLHSLNNGMYGGETLFRWDDSEGKLVFHYFTTQGMVTKGEIRKIDANSFTSIELVEDPSKAGGVTRIEALFRVETDRLVVRSTYFRGEEASSGHSAEYKPAPKREVVFR